MRGVGGFTLIELLVAIAVVAILASVALPSYTAVIQSNRSVNTANDLLGLLTLARSEAIKRNTTVIVCRAATGTTPKCETSGNDWSSGALVVVDTDGDKQVDDVDADVLRVSKPLANHASVTISWSSAASITYRPDGRAGAGTFKVRQSGDSKNKYAKDVTVSATGRPAVRDGS